MLLEPNQIGQWLRSVDQHDAASIVDQCFLREDFVDLIEPIYGGKEVELFNIVIDTPGHIFKRLDSDLAACADQVEYAVRGCAAGVGVSVRHINWVPMVPPAKRLDGSSSVVSADTSVEVQGAGPLLVNKSFDVFLSYNSKDKPAVRELAEALRALGLRVWLDEWELVPGRPWQEALEEVIETSGASAVLVGKDGLGPWQDAEMRGCLSEFVARDLPVIPVLLPDAPSEPGLPLFLRRFTWVDLRGGLTEEGIDRLHWGITGKRPNRSKLPSLSSSPRIILHGPAFHVEQIPFRIKIPHGEISTFMADVLSVIIINAPQRHTESAVAKGLKAEFTCGGNGARLPWIDARLDYSAQPSQLLPGQRPELVFDLGIDQWKKISLIIKEKEAENCHLFNNDSYYHPRAQNPAWRMNPGEYKIFVKLAGVGVREQFECIFINPGKGASLTVKGP
jgi:nucleotide-binding universal stress UspA family protein